VVLSCNAAASRELGNDIEGSTLAERAQNDSAFRRFLALASRSTSPLPASVRFADSEAQYRCDASLAVIDGERFLVLQLRSATDTVRRFLALNTQIDRLQAEIRSRKLLEQEREQFLRSEREARALAEEASRFKDELLTSISHEL
jgi:hypothetical protein